MADLGNTIVRGKLRVTDEIVGPLNVVNLSTGSNGQFLSISNNVPTWVNSPNTNTWRPVVDNLTSTATDQSLSANQGKVLKSYIDTYFAPAKVDTDSIYSSISTSFIGGASGGPRTNDWEFLYRAEHRNGSGDGSNYIMEMVSNLTSDSSIYWRKKTGGNFTAFREIIDSNNISSQSVKSATTADSAIRSNYFNSVASVAGGNTSTYSWRRIMSMGPTTNNYEDRVGTYYLSGNYHGGPWYLFRVEFRTNTSSNGDVGSFRIAVIATNSSVNNLAIASYSVAINGVTTSYADVFVKVGAYPRMTLTRLSASDTGIITYYNSNEGNNASSRTEAYKDINGSGAEYASYDLHSWSKYPVVTNGVIASKFVTTDTDQTITGYKKFSSIGIDTINGATLGNAIMRQDTSTGEVILGSTVRPLRLWGNGSRPVYSTDNGANYKDIAFTSDIPGAATQSANGLMSSADKTKLDGIAVGANNITVDTSLKPSSTNPVQNKVIYTALSPTIMYDGKRYTYGESGSWRLIQYNNSSNTLDIRYGTIAIDNQNKTYDVSFGGDDNKFISSNYTVVFGLFREDRDSWFWSPLVKSKKESGFTVYVRGNTSGDNAGTLMYIAIRSN